MSTWSTVEVGLHVAAGAVAAATAVFLHVTPLGQRRVLRYLKWTAWSTVVWSLSVALYLASGGSHPWTALWLPSLAFTAGAMVLWAGNFTHYEWTPDRRLMATWVGVPTLMLAIRVAGGDYVLFALFVFNTIYCFALLLVVTAWIARRIDDPNPIVRASVRQMLLIAAAVLVAEAFRLNVTDLAAAVVLVIVATTAVRAGDTMQVRPDADALIDDLGALVLVFDEEQQLVDLNAPARLFYTLRRTDPPALGSSASAILGAELPGLDVITINLSAGADIVRFSGYVQRLPTGGTPAKGWICLLRRVTAVLSADDERTTRRALMNRVPTHDPVTGLLTDRAFVQAISSAAEFPGAERVPIVVLQLEASDETSLATAAASLARSWEGRMETVAIGRSGELRLGLVVRDLPESVVVAQTVGGRSVVGRTATGVGTLAHVHDLIYEAAAQLAE
ncbi:hypothetical protein GCM10023350_12420 [Nocardioides endophyticus]|uniref:GGDEF domain-containing protein n=1 Tax=Nocardioides endophyticus TaxID=1353775 RepID=A0ABP8YM07_9ACTN